MLESAGKSVVREFLGSADYKEKVDAIIKQFMKVSEFQKAIREKTKLVIPYVLECCREFFKEDLHRSREGFEVFFIE